MGLERAEWLGAHVAFTEAWVQGSASIQWFTTAYNPSCREGDCCPLLVSESTCVHIQTGRHTRMYINKEPQTNKTGSIASQQIWPGLSCDVYIDAHTFVCAHTHTVGACTHVFVHLHKQLGRAHTCHGHLRTLGRLENWTLDGCAPSH